MNNASILYIEDEEDYQMLVKRILGKAGFSVCVAPSGEEGLRALEKAHPQLLILDVNLPDTDGYALCRRIRTNPRWSTVPVLLLTVRRRPEEWLQGFSAGAVDYLAKPINPPELVERVRACLGNAVPPKSVSAREHPSAEFLLIQAAIAGNRTAFEVLIRKYKQRLLDSLHASGKSAADAEDIVAAAFAKAYERLHQFRGQASFYTWLYRIAFNSHYKKRRMNDESWEAILSHENNLTQLIESDALGSEISKRRLSAQVHDAVAIMPKPYRQMLKWHFIRGLSYRTIAQRMKIPHGTVMSRLFKARHMLRKSWNRGNLGM